MQQVLIRLLSCSMSLTFKFWESNAVVLVFRKLLMMPEIVITLNQPVLLIKVTLIEDMKYCFEELFFSSEFVYVSVCVCVCVCVRVYVCVFVCLVFHLEKYKKGA